MDPTLLDEAVIPEAEQPLAKTKASDAHALGGAGYNSVKSFNVQYYSGMAVLGFPQGLEGPKPSIYTRIGGSHTWNYDGGVWHEIKTEPDLWKMSYKTKKRRARKAPERRGAPAGTEYYWLIVAHQHVQKVDANTYETHLERSKYKLTHKGATSNSWSVTTVKGQRDREVKLLEDAKRRVQQLPPVLGSEKVKVKAVKKGQQKLEDMMFKKNG